VNMCDKIRLTDLPISLQLRLKYQYEEEDQFVPKEDTRENIVSKYIDHVAGQLMKDEIMSILNAEEIQ
jgi:hypothetical protein